MSSNNNSKDKDSFTPAIEYSSNNSEGVPVASQPRPPRNLQDLLRYSTEAAHALGGTDSASSFTPLDKDSKKFLEEAVKSMTVDVVEELLKCIKKLQNVNTLTKDGDPTEYEDALNNLFEFVDDLDVGNDFHKIGGFCIIKPCLESPHNSLRCSGAKLVAELCQNNSYCQIEVLKIGLLPALLKMIDTDVDITVRINALYAVSCLVRGNEEGLKEFINYDGFSVLLRVLQTDVQKLLYIKTAFLLTSLCCWKPSIKHDLINMGYVEQLISKLPAHVQIFDEIHPPALQYPLNAILEIVKDHEAAKELARKPELQFKNLLDYIVKNSEDNEQFKEENEYSKNLIRILFEDTENSGEDR